MAEGFSPDNLVSDHWLVPGKLERPDLGAFAGSPLVSNPDAAILVSARQTLVGVLTFSAGGDAIPKHAAQTSEALVVRRGAGRSCWVSGVDRSASRDLPAQTRTIMAAIAKSLEEAGLSFDDVVKLTAHYVGGATPEELHTNLAIRHAYYPEPEPASTGLPVAGFAHGDCKIAIDVFARLHPA